MKEHKTSKRKRENCVLFHQPSSCPTLLFTVMCPSFSQRDGNSLLDAPLVEAVDTGLPELCCAGGSSRCPRGQVTHLCPAPHLGMSCCGFWVRHVLPAPVTCWLWAATSWTTAGKRREGTGHKMFVSSLQTGKKLYPYTTSEKLPVSVSVLLAPACLRPHRGQYFNMLTEWKEGGNGGGVPQNTVYTDELDCFPAFFSGSLTDAEGLLDFYFLMKAPESPSFCQLLFMMGIFCTSVQLAGSRASHLNHIFFVSLSHTMLNGRLAENPLSNYNNRIIIIIAVSCTYIVSVRLKWDPA